MSLINQMLKDLEQRNAPTETTKPLAGEVRTVSSRRSSLQPMWLLILLVVIVGGAAAWKFWLEPRQMAATAVLSVPAQHALPALVQPKKEVMVAVAPAPAQTPPPNDVVAESVPSRLPGLEKMLGTLPADENQDVGAKATEKKAHERVLRCRIPSASCPPKAGYGTDLVVATIADKQRKEKFAAKSIHGDSSTPLKIMSAAQRAENFYRQAVVMLQQGRVVEAKEVLRQALGEDPVNLDARQLLVGLLIEEHRQSDAVNLLKDGLRLSPEQTGFSVALARLQLESGGRQEALTTLQDGLQHAGDDAEYHAFLAALLQREERHEDAVTHYLIALKSDPAMPSWLVGIGISLQALGKLSDAGDAYSRAQQTQALSPDLAQFVDQRLKQVKQQLR